MYRSPSAVYVQVNPTLEKLLAHDIKVEIPHSVSILLRLLKFLIAFDVHYCIIHTCVTHKTGLYTNCAPPH